MGWRKLCRWPTRHVCDCLKVVLMSGMVSQSLAREPIDSKSPGRNCIVVGAAGESEYGERFANWAKA